MRREVDAHGGEVARDVAGIFVERDEKGALAALAGGGDEGPGNRRFAGARAASDQGIGAAVKAAADHFIEALDAGGDALVEWLRLGVDAIRGADIHARRADDERHFIEDVRRAAVFQHAHGPHRHAIHHALGEQHRAIRHERHEAVALRRARQVVIHLRGDDAGQLAFGEPFVEPVKLAALRRRVVEQTEQHVDGIEDDDLRAHLPSLLPQPGEQSGEVEGTGFHHVGTQRGIHEKELLFLQLGHVPAERRGIGRNAARIFLERDKDARRAPVQRAADQHLECKDRLARAGPAHEQRRAPERQSARGDVVEALDAGGEFLQGLCVWFVAHRVSRLLSLAKLVTAVCHPEGGRKLAGGASHRIAENNGCTPAGVLELPRVRRCRGGGVWNVGSGGLRHRLISVGPSGHEALLRDSIERHPIGTSCVCSVGAGCGGACQTMRLMGCWQCLNTFIGMGAGSGRVEAHAPGL